MTNTENDILRMLLARGQAYAGTVLAASDKAVSANHLSSIYLLADDTIERLKTAMVALGQWDKPIIDREAVKAAAVELHRLSVESFDTKHLLGRMYLGLHNEIAVELSEYINSGPDTLQLRDSYRLSNPKSIVDNGYSLSKLQGEFNYHLANGDSSKARDLDALTIDEMMSRIASMTQEDKRNSPFDTNAIDKIYEECQLLVAAKEYVETLPLELVSMMAWTDELDVWAKRLHEHDTLPPAIAQALLDDGRCNESLMLYELREFATMVEPKWENTVEDMDCSTQASYTATRIGQNLQPMPEQIKANVGLINNYIEGLNRGIEQAEDDLNNSSYDGEDTNEHAQAQVLKGRELKAAATTFGNELVKRLDATRQSKLTADEQQVERTASRDDVDYVRQGHDFAIKKRDKQFTREGMVRLNSLPKIAGLGFEQDEQVVNTALLTDGSLVVITDRLMNLHSPESAENIIALGKLDLNDIVATAVMPGDDEHDLAEFLTIIEHKLDDDELTIINIDGTENKDAFDKMVEAMSQTQTYGMRP